MIRKCNIFFALTLASALSGCNQQTDFMNTVRYRGALKNAMQEGDISAKIDLDSLANRKHLYALGAVENLKGEILIFDGKPFVSTVVDSIVGISSSFSHKATLLVYVQVARWHEVAIPSSIVTSKQLEDFIASETQKRKLANPFPFLLKGRPAHLEWHVIDWPEGDSDHTHEKHKQSGVNNSLSSEEVDVLGFYSEQHHGIFTHHSTNMHLHFKTRSGDLAGHVDDIELDGKMKLYLPLE
ncbi:MAG: acetolactate decarboxylase [bacterium]